MTTISGGALTQQLYGKLFDRLDVDASLGLTQDELKAAASSRSDEAFTAAFEKLDADKDGKISRAEISAGPALSLGADALLTASRRREPGSRSDRARGHRRRRQADHRLPIERLRLPRHTGG